MARNGTNGAEMVGVKRFIVVVGRRAVSALNQSEVRNFFGADEESMAYMPGAERKRVLDCGQSGPPFSARIFRAWTGATQRGKPNWQ